MMNPDSTLRLEDRAASSRPRVLVLMGGPDAEREVSLMGGREVAAALRDADRFDVVEREIERIDVEGVHRERADVVFPVLHGTWGEGGPLQEILEQSGVPYVGSRPRAAMMAMNKTATKMHAAALGIPTPRARELRPDEPCDLAPPLVIKPVDDGSSVDLRICHSAEEVEAVRRELSPHRPHLMAEAYIRGRELTVGMVHGRVLPIIEIRPAVDFYDYQAKYLRDDTAYIVDPPLPPAIAESVRRSTQLIVERLGCRDIARADFIYEPGPGGRPGDHGEQGGERGQGGDGTAWFLEVNTLPGFTTHSLVPMAASAVGISMTRLCASLVERALERAAARASAGGRTGVSPAGSTIRSCPAQSPDRGTVA